MRFLRTWVEALEWWFQWVFEFWLFWVLGFRNDDAVGQL